MAHKWGVPFSAGWLLTRRRDGNPSDLENCRLSAQDCVTLEATDRASADEWTEAASANHPSAMIPISTAKPAKPRLSSLHREK